MLSLLEISQLGGQQVVDLRTWWQGLSCELDLGFKGPKGTVHSMYLWGQRDELQASNLHW